MRCGTSHPIPFPRVFIGTVLAQDARAWPWHPLSLIRIYHTARLRASAADFPLRSHVLLRSVSSGSLLLFLCCGRRAAVAGGGDPLRPAARPTRRDGVRRAPRRQVLGAGGRHATPQAGRMAHAIHTHTKRAKQYTRVYCTHTRGIDGLNQWFGTSILGVPIHTRVF